LSALVWGLGKAGLSLTTEQLVPFVGPLWLYVFGQAIADFGKSAAEVNAAASADKGMVQDPTRGRSL
jgi:hypothetical protein